MRGHARCIHGSTMEPERLQSQKTAHFVTAKATSGDAVRDSLLLRTTELPISTDDTSYGKLSALASLHRPLAKTAAGLLCALVLSGTGAAAGLVLVEWRKPSPELHAETTTLAKPR